MIYLHVIKCCIDPRNSLTNIPNSLCLMGTVYMRSTTLIQGIILLLMMLATNTRLQCSIIVTFILLLFRLTSISFHSCIKLVVKIHILFLIFILRYSPFLRTFYLSLLIPFIVTFFSQSCTLTTNNSSSISLWLPPMTKAHETQSHL